jgi:hypothetical protein
MKPKKEAVMQKVFIKGHLVPEADISAQHIFKFLVGLGIVCKMNIFFGPIVKSPDLYDEETYKRLGGRPPEDVNAVVMWDDSGVQLYIFPTKDNWFSIDIYTCKSFDTKEILAYVEKELSPDTDMEFSTQTAEAFSPWKLYR